MRKILMTLELCTTMGVAVLASIRLIPPPMLMNKVVAGLSLCASSMPTPVSSIFSVDVMSYALKRNAGLVSHGLCSVACFQCLTYCRIIQEYPSN